MQFELSTALTDEILFFMEDQDGEFLLDTREGIIVSVDDTDLDNEDDISDDERYLSLPEWGPSQGFRLMERFAATLRNALIREELSAALDRGRGVFRAFKNTLAQYPETEKLWFAYKDREMKRVVISWYNSLRESWGLELIGEEPEDITALTLEDFHFREGSTADRAEAEELHRACLDENRTGDDGFPTGQILSVIGNWGFPGDISFIAETAGGEFAGYISAVRLPDGIFHVCAVEVKSEYRGLGLGKTLLAYLLERVDNENIPHVTIDLPSGQGYFSRVLLRESFKPSIQRYCRAASSKL